MTKVIDLTKEAKELKPIEFVNQMSEKGDMTSTTWEPIHFNFLELICRRYQNGNFDLFFAYDGLRNIGIFFLGHFNDGTV